MHPLLKILPIGTVVAATTIFICEKIDEKRLREEAKRKYAEAVKALVKEKKKNAVNVRIFDENEQTIESYLEISSKNGVSDSLYVGQLVG